MNNVVDWSAAFQIAVVIIGGLGGWFAKAMFARLGTMDQDMRELARTVNQLQVTLATNYVSKTDHKDTLDNIFQAIRRIEDSLKEKADKP